MRTPESILRDDPPTDGIEAAVLAFRYPSSHRARPWPAAAGLATALAVGAVALRLGMTPAEASPLARIAAAERNAPRCTLSLAEADGRVWLQAWQEGAKSAMRADPNGPQGTSTGYDGKRMWIAMNGTHVAIIQSELTPFRPSLLQKIADYHGRVVRTSEGENGRKTVVVERAASPTSLLQRDTILADRQDRPVSVTHEFFKAGRWAPGGRELRDYDTPIPARTFEFHPPKGYEVYDIDANRARLVEGLRHGPTRTVGGVTARLAGVLQDRGGNLTAVYTGGATPMPDAKALAVCQGIGYEGEAVVGRAPDPRAGKSIGVGGLRFPGRVFRPKQGVFVEATPEPYMSLGGVAVRLVLFKLPKVSGNPARRLRLTLPILAQGKARNVGAVRGGGVPKGTATFDIVTIPSNGGEEIYRLPNVKRAAYAIPLARAKG